MARITAVSQTFRLLAVSNTPELSACRLRWRLLARFPRPRWQLDVF